MNKIISVLLFILSLNSAQAQEKYWISFKDKDERNYDYCEYLSEEAIKNRSLFGLPLYQYSDVPVNPEYLDILISKGAQPV